MSGLRITVAHPARPVLRVTVTRERWAWCWRVERDGVVVTHGCATGSRRSALRSALAAASALEQRS